MKDGSGGSIRSPGIDFSAPWSMNPILGYVFSATVACAFHIIWLSTTLSYAFPPGLPQGSIPGLQLRLGIEVLLCVVGGFMPALVLMIVPWLLAVRGYRRLQFPGWIYFSAIGAVSTVVIGSATASLSLKPLFIEDQTFLEGAVVAAERQGVCMLLAGLLFGLTYWFLSGRRRAVVIAVGAGL